MREGHIWLLGFLTRKGRFNIEVSRKGKVCCADAFQAPNIFLSISAGLWLSCILYRPSRYGRVFSLLLLSLLDIALYILEFVIDKVF